MSVFTQHQIFNVIRAQAQANNEKEHNLDWRDCATPDFVVEIDNLLDLLSDDSSFENDIQSAAVQFQGDFDSLVVPKDEEDFDYNSSIYHEITSDFPSYLDKYIK